MNQLQHINQVKESYPFIDELVDTFYNKHCNELIEHAIESDSDKHIFMMFIMMYFGIHLSVEMDNTEDKKQYIKDIMNDMIKNTDKRKQLLLFIQNKLKDMFTIKKLDNNLLKN